MDKVFDWPAQFAFCLLDTWTLLDYIISIKNPNNFILIGVFQ